MSVAPAASFVRTVLGDISPEQLGACYAHEHLIIDESYTTEQSPDFLLDDVDRCAAELTDARNAGVSAMVDSMPMACGRNVVKLAEASRRSGVHILCPTGLHLRKYYSHGHWCTRLTSEQLTTLFVREIQQGIDANDGNGPEWMPTPHRAGLIKVASGLDAIDEHEHRIFLAAAAAHRLTGAPILTHTEQGTAAMQQVQLFQDNGVDLRHVVISHTDRKHDVAYHRVLLATGVRVEYDSAFRWKAGQPNHTLDLLLALLDEFPDQIMLGMDAARRSYWSRYGGAPGLTFLIGAFATTLRQRGVSDASLHRVFVTTPAAAFSFAKKEQA
ncbi:MAG TPA: hypothetical protein VGN72_19420 [Tepidisphaeraceae bacterium]|nr:hypothetical protein [Tepidisphaeraceae bacterium]